MLNPQQELAVQTLYWPLLINAGAWSGKTHTITERVAAMIDQHGIDPRSILCLTFTNKAAKEMRARIAKKLGIWDGGVNPFRTNGLPMIGTFHSVAAFFLRMFIDRLGYEKDFLIYDSDDCLQVVKECMKTLSIDPKEILPRSLQGAISRAKGEWLNVDVFTSTVQSFFDSTVADVYRLYAEKLRAANALDFDDLLLLFREILRNDEVLSYFHTRFHFFMIDEYQDTNSLQYEIIHILASKTRNICVVGDDWQWIYSWRGANIENILSFSRDYPESIIINLEENYRSTQSIIQAANHVIQNNSHQMKKHLFTHNPIGQKTLLLDGYDEKHEAEIIVKKIESTTKDGASQYSDWAILYRTNGQSRLIEEALIRKQIPYRIFWWVKFYDRKEIKDILAYIRITYNPYDSVSLRRIINIPWRKIGSVTTDRFIALMEREKYSLANIAENRDTLAELPPSARESLSRFLDLTVHWRELIQKESVSALMTDVLEKIQYETYLKEEYTETEYEAKMDNIHEFLNMTSYYEGMPFPDNIASFLEDIALITDQDREWGESKDVVSLMTVHLAKWLEFRNVIVAGVEEGIFPHSHSLLDLTAVEEERRLMYVAMTRAKERLFLSRALERYTFWNYSANPQSRFIREIPESLRENEGGIEQKFFSGNTFPRMFDPSDSKIWPSYTSPVSHPSSSGQKQHIQPDIALWNRVKHPQYGVGTIISLKDVIAEVAFPGLGIKKMNIEIAPLEKL